MSAPIEVKSKENKLLYFILHKINILFKISRNITIKLFILTKEFFISIFDKRTRININGWPELIDNEWIQNFHFNTYLPSKYSNFRYSIYKPLISYFSVFDSRKTIDKCKSPVKIFITGEDVENNFRTFNDECIKSADLSLGFTPDNKRKSNNYIRFPLWLLYYFSKIKSKFRSLLHPYLSRWRQLFRTRSNKPESNYLL